ncbi:hypothetical protein RYH80_19445 [Halobaculum sp. MBLA0147]|uniref:hypothetical protein n=1 Tax=Halobaculum sp. MBLA0147 TaxID=3079934 RepID=UPI003523F2A1
MMDGLITGENDERVGISVIDNNEFEHVIEMEFDGEIKYWQAEDYPEKESDRTWIEDEHCAQTHKFARYHVYRETDHDPLEGHWNPDRVAATLMALWQLSPDRVVDIFGSFYQQCRSHHEDVTRPLELPRAVDDGQTVIYEQEVYLDADLDTIRGAVDAFGDGVAASSADALTELSTGSLLSDGLDALFDAVQAHAVDAEFDFPTFEIADTSELGVMYYDDRGRSHRHGGGGGPSDEKCDARLELPQVDPGSPEEFRSLLLRHLVCQVRDFYIVMGEDPPPAFRVLGLGKHAPTQGYRTGDLYPDYYDFDADIPGYRA